MDRVTSALRSRIMARVRQRDTAPEVSLRRALHACGLRFRVRFRPALPGSPDVIFPAAKVAVFVDGCFWHCCPEHGRPPASNTHYWTPKLERNIERDRKNNIALCGAGWHVVLGTTCRSMKRWPSCCGRLDRPTCTRRARRMLALLQASELSSPSLVLTTPLVVGFPADVAPAT